MHKKSLILTILLLLTSLSTQVDAARKAILVGIDGLQYEKIQSLNTPNFNRLTLKKAYTGGVKGDASEQVTSSGPGWSTILTGVWDNKHLITSNSSGLANPKFPSIFKHIHNVNPNLTQASIQHWATPNTTYFKNDVTVVDRIENGLSDANVTQAAIEEINKGTDFIFMHLDDPDGVGHSSGFGAAYNKSILTADKQLGQIIDAIEASQTSTDNEWLLLVTTDHGRDLTGHGHGNQTTQEKTIFIGSNQTLNSEFSTSAIPINNDFNGLYGHAAQTSLVPTLLSYLDIPIQNAWKLDGPSLYADIGVRKVMPSPTADLTWISDSLGEAAIYKNDRLVDAVTANQQQWFDSEQNKAGTADYVVDLNDNPVAYRAYHVDIQAAVSWSLLRAYFFRDDNRYVRYNKTLDKADSGYPAATNDHNWPGLEDYRDDIVAGFYRNLSTAYFFLSNGQYLSYDIQNDKVRAGYPQPINHQTWPGIGDYATQIAATLRWSGDKVYFFLNSGDYLRFDLGDDHVDNGYPQPINDQTWPGLGDYATEITAALHWNDLRGYIFLKNQRYIRYNIAQDESDSGYPRTTNDNTWPGLMLP